MEESRKLEVNERAAMGPRVTSAYPRTKEMENVADMTMWSLVCVFKNQNKIEENGSENNTVPVATGHVRAFIISI